MPNSNPLRDWVIDPSQFRYVGQDLHRPVCALATQAGVLWVADGRGGVVKIDPDGSQKLVLASSSSPEKARLMEPNGIALMSDGRIMVANVAGSAIETLSAEGRLETLFTRIEGRSLGATNFILRDWKGRYWVTVSFIIDDPLYGLEDKGYIAEGFNPGNETGYIALIDTDGSARIVADGFAGTNEIRIDDSGQWLYVVETVKRTIWRMRIGEDGSLSARERVGPQSLGYGFPDGITFDAFGNLWCTMAFSERIIAITPEGELLELLDRGNLEVNKEIDRLFAIGQFGGDHIAEAVRKADAKLMTSVTFGGPDLRTVYIATIGGKSLPSFRSPVAGQRPSHW